MATQRKSTRREDTSEEEVPQQQTRRSAASQREEGGRSEKSLASDKPDLLKTLAPAVRDVQVFIEGSPVRAAAIGAVAGGLLMTLFATEKGRMFLKSAVKFANPIISKYAREFVSKAAGDMTESALLQ